MIDDEDYDEDELENEEEQEEITLEYSYEGSSIKRIEILTKAEFDLEKDN